MVTEQSPKIYLFCCSNSLDSVDLVRVYGDQVDELKVVPMPCSGKIDILYLTKAFETGADGVAVVTCKVGECRYLEGNLRARKRVEATDALLTEIGLGEGRAVVIPIGEGGVEEVVRQLRDFRLRIKTLPRLSPVVAVHSLT